MLFNYKAVDGQGKESEGAIDAVNIDIAISSLQRRGLMITSVKPSDQDRPLLGRSIGIFNHVKIKDIVILSRQMATLFSAQVSALRVFRLLAAESESLPLRKKLTEVADELQSGSAISKALSKHPEVFSNFYVNMVKSGEESGRLDQTFSYLADYLDRNYSVTSKAKNALIYPAFVVFTFVTVMILMLTLVIPKISKILTDGGQEVPSYTKFVIGLSNFLVNYWPFFLVVLVGGGFFLFRYSQTRDGKETFGRLKLTFPYLGNLYTKLYLSRIADNVSTMLTSGIPMIRTVELTATVVDNAIYENILNAVLEDVKGGAPLSEALGKHKEIPSIMSQMAKVGEETGELGHIFDTLAKFYQREVINAVDTLVDLIEPAMIVLLGLGVGFLLASVLIPIYNISAAI